MLSELTGLDEKLRKKGKILIRDVLEERPEFRKFDYFSLLEVTQEDLTTIVRKHLIDDTQGVDSQFLRMRYIPVVDNSTDMNLLFLVKVSELKEYCELSFGQFSDEKPGNALEMTAIHSDADISLNKIDPEMANVMIDSIQQVGNNPAQTILLNIRRIPPLVLYIDAPISYMTSG